MDSANLDSDDKEKLLNEDEMEKERLLPPEKDNNRVSPEFRNAAGLIEKVIYSIPLSQR